MCAVISLERELFTQLYNCEMLSEEDPTACSIGYKYWHSSLEGAETVHLPVVFLDLGSHSIYLFLFTRLDDGGNIIDDLDHREPLLRFDSSLIVSKHRNLGLARTRGIKFIFYLVCSQRTAPSKQITQLSCYVYK
jgi:hypothetical protein